MQVDKTGYEQASTLYNSMLKNKGLEKASQKDEKFLQEKTLEEEMNNSAVKVSISMNAQIILFAFDSGKLAKDNLLTQGEVFDLLSGKEIKGKFSLADLGYDGKPITKLSESEAKELVSDEGFFGITQTSDRVSNFVFNFSNDNIKLLEKGRAGIVKGFEEAEKLWGGELPEISYKTQERTLELIDKRIEELKSKN